MHHHYNGVNKITPTKDWKKGKIQPSSVKEDNWIIRDLMGITNKLKTAMHYAGKKNIDCAKALGISKQAVSNKLNRESFSAEDLIKISDMLDAELNIEFKDEFKIKLDIGDIPLKKEQKKEGC